MTDQTNVEGLELVHAYRRKGTDDFCTCGVTRYMELSQKPNLFETAVFYALPPDAAAVISELRAEVERLQQTRAICPTCACKIDDAVGVDVAAKNRTIKQQGDRIAELEENLAESDAIRDKCARLLAETAVALKGHEKALHRHGWHDLPQVAAAQAAALAKAREVLDGVVIRSAEFGGYIGRDGQFIKTVRAALAAIDALGQPATHSDAQRWSAIELLMTLGNVELTQADDGGYEIDLEPVENFVGQIWTGDTPEQVVDKVVAWAGQPDEKEPRDE